MTFLSPLALLLFGLSLPLVMLYFLKVRRRERRVPSLLLWGPAQRDREASTFFQRLQRDPLLILQLLALLALALALARPTVTVLGDGARKVVVVLDTSASMKARDVSPSRFDRARAEAAALVRRLSEGAEVMVIESGVQPRVTAALSRDHDRALAAIWASRAHDLPHHLTEAIRIARALVGTDPRAEIHVFTDGAFTLAATPETTDGRLRWVGVGQGGRNLGVTNLAVRKASYGTFEYQAFASLVNWTPESQTFTFTLSIDDKAIAEKSVTLEPSVRRSLVLPFTHNGGGTVKASINVRDDLETDNTAWAVLPPPRKIAVLLVSPGNLFLEKVLRTDPQVAVEVRTPEQYQGGMEDADVVILDSVSPPRVGPGRFVFVNGVPSDVPIEVLGRSAERPTIMDWDRCASDHAARRVLEGPDRGLAAHPSPGGRAPARRSDERPPDLRARGDRPQSDLHRVRSVQDRPAAARGVPADPLQRPALAPSGRTRPVEPAALRGAADPAAGRARREQRDRRDPERAVGEGADHARGGQLHRDRRGRGLHADHRARRDARGGEPHRRGGVEPRAATAAAIRAAAGRGRRADPDPA